MDQVKEKKTELLNWIRASIASIVIHILAFILLVYLANISIHNAQINPVFYSVEFNEYTNPIEVTEEKDVSETVSEPEDLSTHQEVSSANSISFTDINADTTNLDQYYRETTLNVSIKYPRGWTFVDQNVKNKLDGVTFWAMDGIYDPPPYIHLEVKEKYYFNESKYKYKMELENCVAYYNDPEIIENYFIQNVYLRTETNEDFNLKLMMVGEQAFISFQPKFFGMIKTFDFGTSFF